MEVLHFRINEETILDDAPPREMLHYFLSFASIKVDAKVFPVLSGEYKKIPTFWYLNVLVMVEHAILLAMSVYPSLISKIIICLG